MTPELVPAGATLLAVAIVRQARGAPPLLAPPAPPEIPFDPTQVRFYFYGADGWAGHRWHAGARYLADRYPQLAMGCPWGRNPDGTLCRYPVGLPYRYERDIGAEQVEGLARLHHKDGWTAVGYWDRSGPDTRYNVNSNFIAEGTWTFAQMMACAQHYFPQIV